MEMTPTAHIHKWIDEQERLGADPYTCGLVKEFTESLNVPVFAEGRLAKSAGGCSAVFVPIMVLNCIKSVFYESVRPSLVEKADHDKVVLATAKLFDQAAIWVHRHFTDDFSTPWEINPANQVSLEDELQLAQAAARLENLLKQILKDKGNEQ